MKTCKVCGFVGEREAFAPRQLVCLPCDRAAARARMAAKRATPEGMAAHRESIRKWKAANPDKVQAQRVAHRRRKGMKEAPPRAPSGPKIPREDAALDRRHVEALRMIRYGIRPEMSDSEKWAARYRRDARMQLKERLRAMLRKHAKRYAWIASYFGSEAKRQGRGKVWEAVGYSADELRAHLERQFVRGMTWERFLSGEIHIDHIVPKSRFDLDSLEELRACYALSNLRPLWAADNVREGARRAVLL